MNGQDRSPGKILIVDDELSVQRTLAEFMRLEGHECRTAAGGTEALAVLKEDSFDVVVADIIMPDMFGTDFLAAARENYPELAVIMITGAPDMDTAVEALRLRAFDYLVKPVTRKKIINTVDNALELIQLRERNRALEEKNRVYRENLEVLVAERTGELFRLSRRLIDLQETERNNLSRDIHDEVGQSLIALKLTMQRLSGGFRHDGDGPDEFADAIGYLDGIITTCRGIAHRISPLTVRQVGLKLAVERLATDMETASGSKVRVDLGALPEDLDDEKQAHLYRIVQEALTNTIKHANADQVDIQGLVKHGHIVVTIEDNGHGFALDDTAKSVGPSAGIGLDLIRERARLMGGEAVFKSSTGGGTKVEIDIPG